MTKKAPIVWQNITAPLSSVRPWDHNPKQITRERAERLLRLWDELGQFQTIAVGPDFELYDGHQRYSVLKAAGRLELPVDMRQSSRALTTKERKRLVVESHATATGSFDWDMLANEFDPKELEDFGLGKSIAGQWASDIANLKALVNSSSSPTESVESVNVSEEISRKWKTATGQVWELGEHTLGIFDNRDEALLRSVIGEDLARYAIQDPPYGISVVNKRGAIGLSNNRTQKVYRDIVGDDETIDIDRVIALAKSSVVWGGNYLCDRLTPSSGWIVWDKKGDDTWRDDFSDCELAWSNLKIRTRLYKHVFMGMVQEEKERRYHPTQKPVALIERIIRELFVDSGLVIDVFAGSGSTLLACERIGRASASVEIDPAYGAVILERFSQATGKKPKRLS